VGFCVSNECLNCIKTGILGSQSVWSASFASRLQTFWDHHFKTHWFFYYGTHTVGSYCCSCICMDLLASLFTRDAIYFMMYLVMHASFWKNSQCIFSVWWHSRMCYLFAVKIDVCDSMPCQNGGSCIASDSGAFLYCQCLGGFSGTFCEIGMYKMSL
jgi:hypothetical protein